MDDIWQQLQDWWESDDVFRMQIVLAVIVGGIGCGWVILELAARRRLAVRNG